MTRTIISFIGRGAQKGGGYRSASYDFGAGRSYETSYFALALLRDLQAKGQKADKLILLGTSGSMWDVFFVDQGDEEEALRALEVLQPKVSSQEVTQSDIDAFVPALSKRLGVQVEARVISSARELGDQIELLTRISEAVGGAKARVVLDVTHGFRHLPMLSLVASRFLTLVSQATVEQIYYGALEMTTRVDGRELTPVLRLGGLDALLSGVEAAATYAKDGDYAVFADLLDSAGVAPSISKALRDASFFERVSNPRMARAKLITVRDSMDSWQGPMLEFLRVLLKDRFDWIRGDGRADWEMALGDRYFSRRDYLRAAAYWQEGLVTRQVQAVGGSADDHGAREHSREKLRFEHDAFKELSKLRNAMAHGVRHDMTRRRGRRVSGKNLMESEDTLREGLSELRRELEGA